MLTDAEFEELIRDPDKIINGDIEWQEDEDHSYAVEFQINVDSSQEYPLFVKGRYHRLTSVLSYAIIHRQAMRIYALDMGKDHRNPDRTQVGEMHKHRWTEVYRDKQAYRPPDITASATDPVAVWKQFCQEASIHHNGIMRSPPLLQHFFVL